MFICGEALDNVFLKRRWFEPYFHNTVVCSPPPHSPVPPPLYQTTFRPDWRGRTSAGNASLPDGTTLTTGRRWGRPAMQPYSGYWPETPCCCLGVIRPEKSNTPLRLRQNSHHSVIFKFIFLSENDCIPIICHWNSFLGTIWQHIGI